MKCVDDLREKRYEHIFLEKGTAKWLWKRKDRFTWWIGRSLSLSPGWEEDPGEGRGLGERGWRAAVPVSRSRTRSVCAAPDTVSGLCRSPRLSGAVLMFTSDCRERQEQVSPSQTLQAPFKPRHDCYGGGKQQRAILKVLKHHRQPLWL